MQIETERLILRRFTEGDAEEYWPLVREPEIIRFTGEAPFSSVEAVRELLVTRPIRDYEVYGYGRMACIEKSSGRLIGFSGLKYLEDLKEVDVGYRFLKDCWGKGYATESARALMDDGMQRHGIQRMIGLVFTENTASSKVLVKLGLKYHGPVFFPTTGNEIDMYVLDRTEQ